MEPQIRNHRTFESLVRDQVSSSLVRLLLFLRFLALSVALDASSRGPAALAAGAVGLCAASLLAFVLRAVLVLFPQFLLPLVLFLLLLKTMQWWCCNASVFSVFVFHCSCSAGVGFVVVMVGFWFSFSVSLSVSVAAVAAAVMVVVVVVVAVAAVVVIATALVVSIVVIVVVE